MVSVFVDGLGYSESLKFTIGFSWSSGGSEIPGVHINQSRIVPRKQSNRRAFTAWNVRYFMFHLSNVDKDVGSRLPYEKAFGLPSVGPILLHFSRAIKSLEVGPNYQGLIRVIGNIIL